ncbi:putative aspartyl protease At4g16563 [Silene latifolia]|uniref:putative aspartyl protease At4g16563 n=1 Tax=Silene latifolia TaxID=37657 RepID=UPI003D771C4F
MRCPNNNKKMTNPITHFLLLFISLIPLTSSTPTSTITLPLSHFTTHPKPVNTYDYLNHLAKTSLTRAHHLKNPNPVNINSNLNHLTKTSLTRPNQTHTHHLKTPNIINTYDNLNLNHQAKTILLSPQSYGAYSISLKFGTPPQTMNFVMDTGSSFVWFPCTTRYACDRCNFTSSTAIKTFLPKLSSTTKIVGCLNPKCGWLHNPNTESRCSSNSSESSTSTQICPPYVIIYGSGTTGGIALLDTLHLNDENVPDFLVGCSIISTRQPAGIAGFGRGNSSLPSQLGLEKFSYCSLSRKFDDTTVTTALNLVGKSNSGEKIAGITYTPFVGNPNSPANRGFSDYYYLGLNEIFVGERKVKYRGDFLSPPDVVTGFGGTIIDSGTTLTYMSREIFEPLAREFEGQVRQYKRVKEVEVMTGLRPCFNVSGFKTLSFPTLKFHFKGGAKMVFPLENYFSFAGGEAEVVCLTIVTDPPGQETVSGPKVIFGNYQQQNFYIEYDLKHNKLGFMEQKCN